MLLQLRLLRPRLLRPRLLRRWLLLELQMALTLLLLLQLQMALLMLLQMRLALLMQLPMGLLLLLQPQQILPLRHLLVCRLVQLGWLTRKVLRRFTLGLMALHPFLGSTLTANQDLAS
jgi:hypothetical protein